MSKELKIILIIDIIAAVVYGFLYLIIPEPYSQMNDAPAFDLHMWRLFGGTIVIYGICGILALKKGEWENFKPILELIILWWIMVLILDIVWVLSITASSTYLRSITTNMIVLIVLIVVNSYFYYREGK